MVKRYGLFSVFPPTVSGIVVVFLICFIWPPYSESSDLRQIKEPLLGITTVQTVLLKATTKTASGKLTDASHIQKIFSKRIEELGYTVETDRTVNYDVVVQLDCEEQNHLSNKQIDLAERKKSNLSTIQSPPCTLSYQFEGRKIPWQRIDRVIYAEGVKVAKELAITSQARSVGSRVTWFLEHYDFPVLLSAEWGHIDRLIRIFHKPETTDHRQRFIIYLLGEIHHTQAFSFLVKTLKEEHLVTTTARALGHFGEQARPYLITLLQNSPRSEVQAAAAYGLGNVGALTGDTRSTSLLLKVLSTPGVEVAVQTEIVWALGKAPDFGAFQTLEELEQRVWETSSKDPGLQKLRQAINWSIREVRQGGHTDDY